MDDLVKRLRSLYFADDSLLEEVADSIEELEADRRKTYEALLKVTRIHDELEAKLEKAVDALDEAVYLLRPDEKDMMRQAGVYRIVTTLAELKGQKDE